MRDWLDNPYIKAIFAHFLRGFIARAHCIKLGLMRGFVVEWQSFKETGADE